MSIQTYIRSSLKSGNQTLHVSLRFEIIKTENNHKSETHVQYINRNYQKQAQKHIDKSVIKFQKYKFT